MKINSTMMCVKMAFKGYTLVKLAEVSGVSRATLSSIKNGKTCSVPTATKIAKALNIDVMELIESEV